MQKPTTEHEATTLKSQLRLPHLAAPIDRTMTSSVMAGWSGVEPSLWGPVYWPFPHFPFPPTGPYIPTPTGPVY